MRKILIILAAVALFTGCEDDDSENPVAGNPADLRVLINYGSINNAVANMPAGSEDSISSLALYVSDNFESEPERAYFIYRWIRQNIQPDFERAQYYYVDYESQTPEAVFASRRAVCQGYAAVYNELTSMTGLDSRQIQGYGVMLSYTPGTAHHRYKHAWNSVKIDGGWYLLDTSWTASQSLDGSSDPNYFFLTDPSGFVYRHYPYDTEWQLLADPTPENVFWTNLE